MLHKTRDVIHAVAGFLFGTMGRQSDWPVLHLTGECLWTNASTSVSEHQHIHTGFTHADKTKEVDLKEMKTNDVTVKFAVYTEQRGFRAQIRNKVLDHVNLIEVQKEFE